MERLKQWYDRAQGDATRALITALQEDPLALRNDLCAYKLLKNYPPALGQKVLDARWEMLRNSKADTDALDLSSGDSRAQVEINYYLTDIRSQINSEEGVKTLLGQMSGCLDAEFHFLDDLLRECPEWISPVLLRQIEARFAPIRSRIGKPLATLRKLVKPAFPAMPQDDWNAEQWLAWVQKSYMPYYVWLETQHRHDETVMEYAIAFADWFYTHFTMLKNGKPELFSFSALYRERERIAAKGAVTLILIVDNLNYVHYEELCRLFQTQGMLLTSSEPLFSLVPTATEVGKAALIAVTGDQVDLPIGSYPDLVEKEWHQSGSGKPGTKATYLPNLGALQNLPSMNHDLYFLNYLPIDEALHEDMLETGRSHGEVIYQNLATVAKSVADFMKRFQLEKRLQVYVLSDHGATRIAQGIVNVLDPSFYKNLAIKNHHRFVALADDKFKSLPQAAGQQCYLIDRQQFKTNQNYLAARRYYRFLPTTENFYVHGGLTPEEVVVPFARFTFAPLVPDAPTITLLTYQFRFAVKSRISIEVGNPNGVPIENVTVRLLDADAEEVLLDQLGANAQATIELTTTFRKSIGGMNTRPLTVRVAYRCQGTEHAVTDREFTITMRAMVEEKNDFGDIF